MTNNLVERKEEKVTAKVYTDYIIYTFQMWVNKESVEYIHVDAELAGWVDRKFQEMNEASEDVIYTPEDNNDFENPQRWATVEING